MQSDADTKRAGLCRKVPNILRVVQNWQYLYNIWTMVTFGKTWGNIVKTLQQCNKPNNQLMNG